MKEMIDESGRNRKRRAWRLSCVALLLIALIGVEFITANRLERDSLEKLSSLRDNGIGNEAASPVCFRQGAAIVDVDVFTSRYNVDSWSCERRSAIKRRLERAKDVVNSYARFLYQTDRRTEANIFETIDDIYRYALKDKDIFHDSSTLRLCDAIKSRDVARIERLIADGADPNATGVDGFPLLLWSYFNGREVVETLLKNGADPNVVLRNNCKLVGQFDFRNKSLLYATLELATFGDVKTNFFKDYPELLLKYGADPNFNDESPLTLALHWHEYDANEGLIKLLLDKGADISRIDGRYRLGSPLLSAATRYDFGTVVELLKRGAETDPNEFVTRELQRSVCAYRSDYDAASDEERAEAKQYENYVKTVELLKERGISCEEPLAFESEFEKMHSRYWRLFGLE